MKNKILRTSYISFTILIFLLVLEIIITNSKINSFGTFIRGAKVVLSYFFHLPLYIINLILVIKILLFYFKNKFQNPRKYFYLVLPSLIFYVACLFYLVFDGLNVLLLII